MSSGWLSTEYRDLHWKRWGDSRAHVRWRPRDLHKRITMTSTSSSPPPNLEVAPGVVEVAQNDDTVSIVSERGSGGSNRRRFVAVVACFSKRTFGDLHAYIKGNADIDAFRRLREGFDSHSHSLADPFTMQEASSGDEETAEVISDSIEAPTNGGLKVLFLSSDTGGGHRASAESLAKQFQLLFPGTTYDLLDIVEKDGTPPYSSLVNSYKHLSAHPSQWKLVYTVSNSRAFEMLADAHLKLMCERAVRRRIKSYNPDVVVSVHPLMTNVPVLSCAKISNETKKHLPMFTVVTDLGSAHCLWFANGVEKLFVGSDQVKELAKVRGKVPDEKIVKIGLPIRHDFSVQAEKLGNRHSDEGRAYQKKIREELKLPVVDRKTILVMGGGEGVGSLQNIVEAMYVELVSQSIDALILVVCGRNEKLKNLLENREWSSVYERWRLAKDRVGLTTSLLTDYCGEVTTSPTVAGCIESGTVTGSIRRMLSTSSLSKRDAVATPHFLEEEKKAADEAPTLSVEIPDVAATTSIDRVPGQVTVMGLGFVTKMADYMVAADVLVSKAGPGTISEAAALSLPVMLTSFLPGQEEGNVDFVIDGGFGAFCSDSDPIGVAEEVALWLTDSQRLENLSRMAKTKGAPYAARDIAKMIGDSTLKWREHNEEISSTQES